jgi:hypothetical protein
MGQRIATISTTTGSASRETQLSQGRAVWFLRSELLKLFVTSAVSVAIAVAFTWPARAAGAYTSYRYSGAYSPTAYGGRTSGYTSGYRVARSYARRIGRYGLNGPF